MLRFALPNSFGSLSGSANNPLGLSTPQPPRLLSAPTPDFFERLQPTPQASILFGKRTKKTLSRRANPLRTRNLSETIRSWYCSTPVTTHTLPLLAIYDNPELAPAALSSAPSHKLLWQRSKIIKELQRLAGRSSVSTSANETAYQAQLKQVEWTLMHREAQTLIQGAKQHLNRLGLSNLEEADNWHVGIFSPSVSTDLSRWLRLLPNFQTRRKNGNHYHETRLQSHQDSNGKSLGVLFFEDPEHRFSNKPGELSTRHPNANKKELIYRSLIVFNPETGVYVCQALKQFNTYKTNGKITGHEVISRVSEEINDYWSLVASPFREMSNALESRGSRFRIPGQAGWASQFPPELAEAINAATSSK